MSDPNPPETDNIEIGDSVSTTEKKSRKDKSKSLSTKVVIRRLPPSMDEETFLNQIQPVPEYDYFYFVTADWSLGQNATSRAYINFINEEDIFIFKDRFDGYVFVEAKGSVEYPAVVEFAPFQGLPKSKSRKKDNKCNTIETDPDFMKFLTLLNGDGVGDVKPEMKMEYSYQIKDEKKITSTPLLEFIANKKVERREERKKKIDDRKRQRDDDRNRKKSQVAKSIPSSIREQDEDGIIVRVVKSRPRDRGDRMKKDRNAESSAKPTSSDVKQSKPESNREEKRRLEREQREAKRKEERQRFREERDQKRQSERERSRKERDSTKKEEVKTEKPKVETDAPNRGTQKDDRVKRYSESRRARMENKDQSDVVGNKAADASDKQGNGNKHRNNEARPEKSSTVKSDENKDAPKEKAEPVVKSHDDRKSKAAEDSKNNDDSSGGDNGKSSSSKALTKEERLARRIRNKDRPSLQIYQPGQSKRRMSTKRDDDNTADDASPKILSKPSSPTLSEHSIVFPVDKPTVKKVADKLKNEKPTAADRVKSQPSNEKGRSEKTNDNSAASSSKTGQPIGKSSQSQDESAPVERKVSRYSERRNKIKEKQNSKLENADGVIEAVQMTSESKNDSSENNNSEV